MWFARLAGSAMGSLDQDLHHLVCLKEGCGAARAAREQPKVRSRSAEPATKRAAQRAAGWSLWWSRSGSNRRPLACHTGEGVLEPLVAVGRRAETRGSSRARTPILPASCVPWLWETTRACRRPPIPDGYPTGGHCCGSGHAVSVIQTSGRRLEGTERPSPRCLPAPAGWSAGSVSPPVDPPAVRHHDPPLHLHADTTTNRPPQFTRAEPGASSQGS
jgi:hypothetical protein